MVADARRALNALRVMELKSLCKECGLGTAGRKFDLIERLVDHKQKCQVAASGAVDQSPRVAPTAAHAAVHESDARLGHAPAASSSLPSPAGRQQLTLARSPRPPASGGSARQSRAHASPASRNTRVVSDMGAGDRAAGSPAAARPIRCSQCREVFDLQHLMYSKGVESFWCPPCRFKVMDPLNSIVEPNGILKVAPVMQSQVDFLLDLPELRQWRKEGYGIECRMVSADSLKASQVWPNSMLFCANNKEVFVIKPPEDGHKRRDVPQGISAGLKHGTNTISVRVSDEAVRPPSLVLAIVLTRARELKELCSQVTPCKELDARRRIISLLCKQRQSSGVDEDLMCLSNDKLRLQCPISMGRIEDPVRGEHCQHFQCFDLESYIQSNQQIRAFNNRWGCPVCSLVLRPSDLVRDEYVARVLRDTSEDIEEVIVSPNGDYRVPPQSQRRVEEDSPVAALDLDDDPPSVAASAEHRRDAPAPHQAGAAEDAASAAKRRRLEEPSGSSLPATAACHGSFSSAPVMLEILSDDDGAVG